MAEFLTLAPMINSLILLVALAPQSLARAAEEPKDIVAAQIRSQGYKCVSPKGATRDAGHALQNGARWILECRNATYRVQLIPHMAAKVELVPPEPPQKDPALLAPQDRN
ncbi:MAG TPA: hypothetical protein VED87_09180 [Methylocystis sp.]|nr:hypothetical protein [Methylocystis sp.]